MWITWKVIVRETCFWEKIQADYTLSWVFQKYFYFVPMLESHNVNHVKGNCSWDMFCEKILADFTVSWAFQKYFNFVSMLESRNVDHVKSNCSWDMFLWKHSGRLHSFMSFWKFFQLCTHATITKRWSRDKWLFVRHLLVKKFRRTTHFHDFFKNISTLYPC